MERMPGFILYSPKCPCMSSVSVHVRFSLWQQRVYSMTFTCMLLEPSGWELDSNQNAVTWSMKGQIFPFDWPDAMTTLKSACAPEPESAEKPRSNMRCDIPLPLSDLKQNQTSSGYCWIPDVQRWDPLSHPSVEKKRLTISGGCCHQELVFHERKRVFLSGWKFVIVYTALKSYEVSFISNFDI